MLAKSVDHAAKGVTEIFLSICFIALHRGEM